MAAQLRLELLGGLAITLNEKPLEGLRSRKAQALLCYLAVTAKAHTRVALAGLLWPDTPEARARNNLRQDLSRLRRVLPFHLQFSRDTVAFDRSSSYSLDVEDFESLLCAQTEVNKLAEALSLYQGDFLHGIFVRQAPTFEDWVLLVQERLREQALQALHRLAAHHSRQGELTDAIHYSRHLLELEPWREDAHRQLMLLYVRSGQRGSALAQYVACCQVLETELDVEPEAETTALYARIRDGEVGPEELSATSSRQSRFLSSTIPVYSAGNFFVARENELEKLHGFLDHALDGQGQVVFVTGEAGSGKSALLWEFARRAQEREADLVAARGACSAYAGVGDPYLPWREIFGALTDDKWFTPPTGTESEPVPDWTTLDQVPSQGRWLNHVIQTLVDHGPNLVDTFVSGRRLLNWAMAHPSDATGWSERLQELLIHQTTLASGPGPDQNRIFEEYTAVLLALAASHPMLLLLDDIHWADRSSISLLFHLSRRIDTSRILIVSAYRPEEIAWHHHNQQGASGDSMRYSLQQVVSEFKRYFGDIWVDLDQTLETSRRRFLEAVLDKEPNRLGESFRRSLFRRTQGHALFTIELLRDMRDRGDLVQDEEKRWVEGPASDWHALPARIEGVIEKRIGRLEPDMREILSVASVQGEDFHVQVVAGVLGLRERQLLRRLSQQLDKRHRLVREREEARTGEQRPARYRFTHALFQHYLYNELGDRERLLLHGEIGAALELLYKDDAEAVAVQLAHHFGQSEVWDKAFHYLLISGDKARRALATREAIAFYTRAAELSHRITSPLSEQHLLSVYEGRGLIWVLLSENDKAIADFLKMRHLANAAGNPQKEGESLCHLAFAYWGKFSEDVWPLMKQCAEEAYQLAQQTGDRRILAKSLTALGFMHQWRGDLKKANRQLELSLEISRRKGYRGSIAQNLMWLSAQANWQGNFARAVQLGHESLIASRAIHDGLNELFGHAFLSLASGSAGNYGRALSVLREGLSKATEWENALFIGRLTNQLGWVYSELGDFSQALAHDSESLEMGRTHGIPNVEISGLINIGLDHLALGQHARARAILEPTLERVLREAYGSHRWRWEVRLLIGLAELHWVTGAYEQALRYVDAALKAAQATSSQKYVVKGRALRGNILLALRQQAGGGQELERAFRHAERLQSPSLIYPVAFDLGQWYEKEGQEQRAVEVYGKAEKAIEQITHSVIEESLRSSFLQSISVQMIHDRSKSLHI